MKKILLALLFLLPCALWGQASSRRSAYGLILSLDSQLLGIETLDGLEPDRTAVLSTHPKVGGGAGAFGRWAVANGLW
ncbi:MAG TPA: hypothetical protein PKW90_26405, partial [Myxococcota bacterium]|nr:hypothetical protein [Myxococcota bacterium]